jgi:hypothetical protein
MPRVSVRLRAKPQVVSAMPCSTAAIAIVVAAPAQAGAEEPSGVIGRRCRRARPACRSRSRCRCRGASPARPTLPERRRRRVVVQAHLGVALEDRLGTVHRSGDVARGHGVAD